ncbi:MAG: cytochrome c5 family protein [Gammaproteobacteria bacterium]|nr:MAG: cytochrome c5 family protein [Gammaproteobacteria bacterium]
MLKRILLSLLFLPLIVACEKKEAPAPATPPAPPAVVVAPDPVSEAKTPTTMAAAPKKVAGGNPGKGEETYKKTCFACHDAGVAGAPKLGDKANWGPRIAQGMDKLYTNSIKGFQGKTGVMPPKGGNTALSDADVKAAVDFMVSKAK